MKFLIAVFLLSVFCHNPAAAQFPVQANLQIVPPYSPYLSDYAGGNGDRLILTLLLNESPTVLLPVRLRFRISGTPLFGRDASFLLPNPIELQGGIPTRFSGADLTSYFNHWNMGLQTDRLPDGLYNFEFEVLDTQRGIAVSNKARASLWIVLGKAPQLNFPVQNSIVQALEPQNVSFSWVARSLSPNSTFQTSYRFTLVEIVPSDREANEAILTTRPLYEEEITGTGLLYGISHPPLEKGRRYAWRVRAVDGSGRDYFENSGFSEVYSFIYGTDCGIPADIKAEAVSPSEIRWKGTGGTGNSAVVLRYRKTEGDGDWRTLSRTIPASGTIDIKAEGLAADTEYAYEIESLCSSRRVGQSEKISGKVRTPKDGAAGDFECGRTPDLNLAEIRDLTPYPGELKVGDKIKAADSEMTLVEVRSSGPGRISGRATVQIPAFKNGVFTAEFDNVLINQYKRLASMEGNAMYIRSVNVAILDPELSAFLKTWIGNIDKILDAVEGGLKQLEELEAQIKAYLDAYQGEDKAQLKADYAQAEEEMAEAKQELEAAKTKGDQDAKKAAKKKIREAFMKKAEVLKKLVAGTLRMLFKDLKKIIKETLAELKGKSGKEKDSLDLKQSEYRKIVKQEHDNSVTKRNSFLKDNPNGGETITVISIYEDRGVSFSLDDQELNERKTKDKGFANWSEAILKLKKVRIKLDINKIKFDVILEMGADEIVEKLQGDIQGDLEKLGTGLMDKFMKGDGVEEIKKFVKEFIIAKLEERISVIYDLNKK